jgi:protein-disulfide isomerase
MNHSMHQDQFQEEVRLTKRQRRELKRQERSREQEHRGRRKHIAAWVLWGILGALIGGGIVWLVINSSGPSGTDLTLMKEDKGDPFLGGETASVVVREFSDFQCPACKGIQNSLKGILQANGDRIRFEFSDFPLVSIHPNALFAAEAAQCAHRQEKFWPYHDVLYEKQSEWSDLKKDDALAAFKRYGADLGLTADTFNACVDNAETRDIVQEDINQGNAADVSATPTFYVNDTKLVLASSIDELQQLIDQELAKENATNANTAGDNTNM